MIVIFDRQHYGKPARNDMGAGYDLDSDGNIENQEREVNLTPLYYQPAREQLRRLGHDVYVFDSGWYSQRHHKANALAKANPSRRVAYLACHVNAGLGDYAVCIYDERSRGGKDLANVMSAAIFDHNIDGIGRSLVRGASETNSWRRGFSTIKGIYAGPKNISGICFEPYFIDREEHGWLGSREGGQAIADALVDGLVRWGQGV